MGTAMNDPSSASLEAAPRVVAGVHGLRKSYGSLKVLDGVTFRVAAGEALGLLGPNGAGKSTTISLLLGLSVPRAGTVELFGGSPLEPANRLRVGYSPESPIFAEHHSASSALDLHARILGIAPPERPERIRRALAEAGLHQATHANVRTLSKGMLQRLGLAVALLGDPELLVLDEPTSNLDPVGRKELCDLVVANRKRGRSVVLASHVLSEIEATCDRVVILNHGRVARSGTLEELRGPDCRPLEQVFFEALAGATENGA
jgi:ABC-2 type transport system ATP-binding protein